MEYLSLLSGVTAWLFRNSCQASIVIGLVLLAQWAFRKKLSLRWRYSLWLLVVIRLMLPVSVESSFSLFNQIKAVKGFAFGNATGVLFSGDAPSITVPSLQSIQAGTSRARVPSSAFTDSRFKADGAFSNSEQAQPTDLETVVAPRGSNQSQGDGSAVQSGKAGHPKGLGSRWSWQIGLSLVWVSGVLFLLWRIICSPMQLGAQLARHETATCAAAFEILEQSKRLAGMNVVLPIIQSRAVQSPALLGFIRPWLLLPDGMLERFTSQELRLVFLHELAHLKRRDIAVNWLMTVLQILHWFNPLVWFAFARMRADRELACDELALSFADAGESKSYGQAIIKLLEGFSRPAGLPGLVGILEDKQQMKRRITMIAQFRQTNPYPSVALVLLLTLGLATLTDAQSSKTTVTSAAQTASPTRDGARDVSGQPPQEAEADLENQGMSQRTVVSGTNSESGGQLSPDERKISYVDLSEQSGDLLVKYLTTGKTQKLTQANTNSPHVYEFADGDVWSPDSKSIAFEWRQGTNADSDLRIASLSDGKVRVLKEHNPELSFYPYDWSADGKALLVDVMRKDHTRALAMVSVQSGEVRQLISLDWNGGKHARFSLDGKFVVFERTIEGNRDVFLLEAGGSHLVRLTDSPAEDGSPLFTPDGKMVLFSSNRGGSWKLWGIQVKDGKALDEPVLIKSDFGDHEKRLTQDGKIRFTRQGNPESDAYYVEVNRSTGQVSDRPKRVAASIYAPNLAPVWSPDGKKIAYIRDFKQLYIQTVADGREEVVLSGMGDYINKVFWSPDGKWLALSPSGPKGQRGVYAYNLETRELRLLYSIADNHWSKGWSPDGTEFYSKHEGKFEANNLATGATRVLFAGTPEPILEFDFSPDQKRIVYVTKGGESEQVLAVSDRSFQNQRVLKTFAASVGSPVWPRWSPDGSMIAYYQTGQAIELWITAPDGVWETKVPRGRLEHFGNLKPPEWSPDSTKLGMALERPGRGEVGLLENFLPKEKVALSH
jgi:beta-lactamase regulating signal transducer with metallopeptidase domain/Tol biopolymer transport system component